jgi:hypothetical protein
MKNNQKRVFAYTQAKSIENAELANVSGGGGALVTSKQTVQITGNGIDVAYDVSWDW